MERDRAVVSDAHGHVRGVHVLADIVRMHTVNGESNDTDAVDVGWRSAAWRQGTNGGVVIA